VAVIAGRIGRLLTRRDVAVDPGPADPLAAESLALAGLASAAVQGRLALGPRTGLCGPLWALSASSPATNWGT